MPRPLALPLLAVLAALALGAARRASAQIDVSIALGVPSTPGFTSLDGGALCGNQPGVGGIPNPWTGITIAGSVACPCTPGPNCPQWTSSTGMLVMDLVPFHVAGTEPLINGLNNAVLGGPPAADGGPCCGIWTCDQTSQSLGECTDKVTGYEAASFTDQRWGGLEGTEVQVFLRFQCEGSSIPSTTLSNMVVVPPFVQSSQGLCPPEMVAGAQNDGSPFPGSVGVPNMGLWTEWIAPEAHPAGGEQVELVINGAGVQFDQVYSATDWDTGKWAQDLSGGCVNPASGGCVFPTRPGDLGVTLVLLPYGTPSSELTFRVVAAPDGGTSGAGGSADGGSGSGSRARDFGCGTAGGAASLTAVLAALLAIRRRRASTAG